MGLVTLTFDLLTGMRVTSKVRNLPSEFGHARRLGSRNIRYVCDRQTDGRTNATLIAPFPTGGGIINWKTELSRYTTVCGKNMWCSGVHCQ